MGKKTSMFLLISMGFIGWGNLPADPAQDDAIKKGREHYKMFCINCHGFDADGKGPYAESMKISPSDLTALNQTGDICVAERVLKAVAGKHDVAPGQQQNMPVFSGNLAGITIYELTQYLKSIQK